MPTDPQLSEYNDHFPDSTLNCSLKIVLAVSNMVLKHSSTPEQDC